MGMVFQQFNLFPHLTVMQNLTLAPIQTGQMSREEATRRQRSSSPASAFWRRPGVYPKQLSGGQQQRTPLCAPCA